MHQGPGRHLGAQTRATDTASHHANGEGTHRLHESSVDAEAGMLSGVSRKRSIRSSPCWFTEFCNSQCLSHFAAPFIVDRAETSVAESCVRKRYADESGTGVRSYAGVWQRDGSRGRPPTPRGGGGRAAQTRRPRSWARAMKTVRPSPATARHHTGASYAHRAHLHPRRRHINLGSRGTRKLRVRMILPQVHLRKPCYDFSFL